MRVVNKYNNNGEYLMRKKEFMSIAENYFNAELKHSHACFNGSLNQQYETQLKVNIAKEKLLKAIETASQTMTMP